MSRTIVWIAVLGLAVSAGCSRDDAERAADAAKDAATPAVEAAGDLSERAGNLADRAAGAAEEAGQATRDAARSASDRVSGDAVATCRALAERGAWNQALEVCRKAHELMPDDPALEHAYQQAQAAAAQ